MNDFVAGSPRETLKTAFKLGIISDDVWMDMLKLRNLLSHDYDLSVVNEAFDRICNEYIRAFGIFADKVEDLLKENNIN